MRFDQYKLVPVEEKDIPLLWSFYQDPEQASKMGHHVPIRSQREFASFFEAKLNASWREFFLLQNESGEKVAFGFSHEHRTMSCCMSLAVFPKYQNVGVGPVMAVKLLDYLFARYPIERVFEHVFEDNEASRRLNDHVVRRGWAECFGLLPSQGFYNGRSRGIYIYSITRETFYNECVGWISSMATRTRG